MANIVRRSRNVFQIQNISTKDLETGQFSLFLAPDFLPWDAMISADRKSVV